MLARQCFRRRNRLEDLVRHTSVSSTPRPGHAGRRRDVFRRRSSDSIDTRLGCGTPDHWRNGSWSHPPPVSGSSGQGARRDPRRHDGRTPPEPTGDRLAAAAGAWAEVSRSRHAFERCGNCCSCSTSIRTLGLSGSPGRSASGRQYRSDPGSVSQRLLRLVKLSRARSGDEGDVFPDSLGRLLFVTCRPPVPRLLLQAPSSRMDRWVRRCMRPSRRWWKLRSAGPAPRGGAGLEAASPVRGLRKSDEGDRGTPQALRTAMPAMRQYLDQRAMARSVPRRFGPRWEPARQCCSTVRSSVGREPARWLFEPTVRSRLSRLEIGVALVSGIADPGLTGQLFQSKASGRSRRLSCFVDRKGRSAGRGSHQRLRRLRSGSRPLGSFKLRFREGMDRGDAKLNP